MSGKVLKGLDSLIEQETAKPTEAVIPAPSSLRSDSRKPGIPEIRKPAAPERGSKLKSKRSERMVRKELYIWEDQEDALTAAARRLARAKPRGEGERITEATLMRVAIDLLLLYENELRGWDEEQLRASVMDAHAKKTRGR